MRALVTSLAAATTLLVVTPASWAHDESLSTSDVEVAERTITWKVDVGVGGLAKVIKLPTSENDLNETALQTVKDAVARSLAAGLTITADGRPLVAQVGALEPRFEAHTAGGKPDLARVVQTFIFRSEAPIAAFHARVEFFAQLTSQHRALIQVRWGQQSRQFVRRGPTEIAMSITDVTPATGALVGELIGWGMFHIFHGYDHIAFLLALLLAITRLRELVTIVTAFTLAHSLTLLAASLDVLRVPVRLTEILIATSIVYIAAENLASGRSAPRHRWLITFAFGLIHGFGFATELKDRLLELGGPIVLPVLAFNLGVEVGQLGIVALVYPLFSRLRRAPTEAARTARQRRLVVAGSVPILIAGVIWLLYRLTT